MTDTEGKYEEGSDSETQDGATKIKFLRSFLITEITEDCRFRRWQLKVLFYCGSYLVFDLKYYKGQEKDLW